VTAPTDDTKAKLRSYLFQVVSAAAKRLAQSDVARGHARDPSWPKMFPRNVPCQRTPLGMTNRSGISTRAWGTRLGNILSNLNY
jgi:hypothetical protein